MTLDISQKIIGMLNDIAEPLSEDENQYSSLLDKIGESRFVLIGEATHGTHEFYQARANITQQLIMQKGFMAIAIEGDWPDTYRIHRYLQGKGDPGKSENALGEFKRFPKWMWRNTTVVSFLEWLRTYNDNLPSSSQKIGFYGLDLYSLHSSMEAVIHYLSVRDPEAAESARKRYACFDHLACDPQTYGYLTSQGLKKPCLDEAIEQILELQRHAFEYVKKDVESEDEFFYAEQNARLVEDAETYYRGMYEGKISTWNIRDMHMLKTLSTLSEHLENKFNKPAKIIVWAHNSHVGDARATEMKERGEVNLGQLTREHLGSTETYLIGFSTYQGLVTAADDWGSPAKHKIIKPGMEGSYEALFHQLKHKNFILDLNHNKIIEHYLHLSRLQRAIGVIYRPETERYSHYFFTKLPYQFDCVIHFDKTTAVKPLDSHSEWNFLSPSSV
ncbi:MAG: erythromycin esterase family protein [Gammaproteobacteria bacterium]|nr:erythromycin esterase family protein [Gammaproteobacteria bacterium]